MIHRSNIFLALLSICIIPHFGLLNVFQDARNAVEFKIRNNATPSVSALPNASSSSPSTHLHVDKVKGEEVTILDDTATSSSHQKSDQVVNASLSSNIAKNKQAAVRKQFRPKIINEPPTCCLRPSVDLEKKFTPEFFEYQRTCGADPQTKWTGKEYEEWLSISARLNPEHLNQTSLDCQTQYYLLVLDQVSGYFLRTVLTELGQNKLGVLPYYKETPGLKRIMLLGDSVSRGIRSRTQQLYRDKANIQGAPANCMGFEKYQSGLKEWLGYCPWDLVQFNVGLHYHPEFPDNYTSWREEYRQGIIEIFKEIRAHSPSAHIVFALTTPSPFDSSATTPDKATCPHYDKFHKKGFISAMNEVVISLSQELGMIINDRYSFILPVLEKHQNKCDVHFGVEGSKLMATEDWKLFAELLSLGNNRQGGVKSTSVAS